MFTLHVKVTHEHNVSTSVVEVLRNLVHQVWGLRREIQDMALDFTNFDAAIAALREDVQNVIRKLNEPDTEAQARIDAATAALGEIDAALDAVAPDAPPAEPTE